MELWKHHVAHLLPAVDDADAIHTLWVLLIGVHDRRYREQKLTQVPRGII